MCLNLFFCEIHSHIYCSMCSDCMRYADRTCAESFTSDAELCVVRKQQTSVTQHHLNLLLNPLDVALNRGHLISVVITDRV